MRISAVAGVYRASSERVDSIHWHESSKRIRAVEAQEAARSREFQAVMDRLKEEPERRQMRVIEVLSAPGLRGPRHFRVG